MEPTRQPLEIPGKHQQTRSRKPSIPSRQDVGIAWLDSALFVALGTVDACLGNWFGLECRITDEHCSWDENGVPDDLISAR
jgi:hypothetical protein